MPYELEIDASRRVCIVRGIGEVTDADVDAAQAEAEASAGFLSDFSEIVDLTRVTRVAVTTERIRRLARGTAIFSKESRRVFIAPSSVAFGLSRMFEMLRGGDAGEIRVFHDTDEALRWLEESRRPE